jgi:hypothetical protein
LALRDFMGALSLLQAACGLLVPPKDLTDVPEMGAMINDLMHLDLFPPVDAAPAQHPLERKHSLPDRLCYELHYSFEPHLAEAVIFCSQFGATTTLFNQVDWRHALALSLILTDQVAAPPPWLSEINVGEDILVHLLIDSCYDQEAPNMVPYQFVVTNGFKCRFVPSCLWMRARRLEPGHASDDKWTFLVLAIGETLTSAVITERWSPQGPTYSITNPIPLPAHWREASVLYHAAECNHVDLVRRMLTLGPDLCASRGQKCLCSHLLLTTAFFLQPLPLPRSERLRCG